MAWKQGFKISLQFADSSSWSFMANTSETSPVPYSYYEITPDFTTEEQTEGGVFVQPKLITRIAVSSGSSEQEVFADFQMYDQEGDLIPLNYS